MKEKLEQILKHGKKVIITGLSLGLISLTTPYCGGSGGDPVPTPTPNNPPVSIAKFYSAEPSNQHHTGYVHPGNLVTLDGDSS